MCGTVNLPKVNPKKTSSEKKGRNARKMQTKETQKNWEMQLFVNKSNEKRKKIFRI